MPENNYNYIWRCCKCSNHFANIIRLEGQIKQEKKCPKCKSINVLTISPKEITVQCKYAEPEDQTGDYY